MQPAPNLVVADRFRLQRLIGRGGMGSVWLATHLGLDIPCAVKFIEGEFGALPEAQARFAREARAAAQLRSPHVVQILDHGVWQGTPYMAMELLDGEDLGKRLARIGRMAPKDICLIMGQVARALTKAHAAGIVHRDLKPDNIFLVHDDDREIAKVLDFGIAKLAAGPLEGGSTKTGAMLGTPYYMSPEQAQGTKAVDHRSDLWSLAVIVYVALTGQRPFESEALGDLLVKIIVLPVPMPCSIAPDLPIALDRWWAKAASRDPGQRYQSAKELIDGLSLVFGQSQLTDVMDRSDLRAAMGSDAHLVSAAPANTPQPYGGPAVAPTAMMSTPRPVSSQASQGSAPMNAKPQTSGTLHVTPHPMGYTPAPGQQAPPAQHVTTGAPMARTFGATPMPSQGRAAPIVAIVGGIVALCVLGGGTVLALKLRHPASATASASISALPPVASSPGPSASASVTVMLPPPDDTASASAPIPGIDTAAPTVAAVPAAKPRPGNGGGVAPPQPVPPPAKPPAAHPGKKPSEVDLGI